MTPSLTPVTPGSAVLTPATNAAPANGLFATYVITSFGGSYGATSYFSGLPSYSSTNANTLFQNALSHGGTIYVTAGTYVFPASFSSIPILSSTRLVLAPDAILDFSACPNNAIFFTCYGTLGSTVALTANQAVGDATVTVASGGEAGFIADDLVLIGSEAYYEARTQVYGAGTGQKIGEMSYVASTSAGSIALNSPLAAGYTDTSGTDQLVYKTTDSAFIAKVTPNFGVVIEGGKILGKTGSGTSSTQQGFDFQYCRHVRIRNVRFEHVATASINLRSVIDGRVEGCSFLDAWNSNNGYGVTCGDASMDCFFERNYFRRCRHSFTTTATGGTHGIVRRVSFSHNNVYDSVNSGDAIDTHAPAENVTFDGNTVYDSSGLGINMECSSGTIINNVIYRCSNGGINIHNETFAPTAYLVANNRIHYTAGVGGIRHNYPITANSGQVIRFVNIQGNQIYKATTTPIYVNGDTGASFNLTGITVSGNIVDSCTDSTGNIYIQYVDDFVCSGNIIRNPGTSHRGVRIAHATGGAVTGNLIKWYVASASGKAFVYETATDITASGNVARATGSNTATGFSVDDASGSCTFMGNDLKGCNTPLSLGAGSGHISTTSDNSGAYNRT